MFVHQCVEASFLLCKPPYDCPAITAQVLGDSVGTALTQRQQYAYQLLNLLSQRRSADRTGRDQRFRIPCHDRIGVRVGLVQV